MTRPSSLARRANLTAALALALTACSASPEAIAPTTAGDVTAPDASASAAIEILSGYELDGLDARGIVDTLDATALEDRATDLMVSVRPDELLISDADGAEASLPMPDDAFYVSMAPYVDTTHECYFHSLTTCTGELGDAPVQVRVVDVATGKAIVDETRTAGPNGFVGLWLPRDGEFEVTLGHDGLTATETVTTDDADDATCVTTMQLA